MRGSHFSGGECPPLGPPSGFRTVCVCVNGYKYCAKYLIFKTKKNELVSYDILILCTWYINQLNYRKKNITHYTKLKRKFRIHEIFKSR